METTTSLEIEYWTKLQEDQLPPARVLVWVKRKGGNIYIGYRLGKAMATNTDASQDCHWHGNPSDAPLISENSSYSFRHHFSDVTVEAWAIVEPPK